MSYLIVHLNAGSNDGEVVLEVFHLNMIFPYFYILELLNWLQLNQELGEYFAFVDTTFNFCIIFRPVLTKKRPKALCNKRTRCLKLRRLPRALHIEYICL